MPEPVGLGATGHLPECWLGRVESWAMWGPDPHSPHLAGEVGCKRTGPSLYGVAGLSRRIFSFLLKKKKTLWGTLGNSPAAAAPVSSPPGQPPSAPAEV